MKYLLFTLLLFASIPAYMQTNVYTDILTYPDGTTVNIKISAVKIDSVYYYLPDDSTEYARAHADIGKFIKGGGSLKAYDIGVMDAHNFHRKDGEHIVLGIFTGVFGVIGSALSSPKPNKNNIVVNYSHHKDLLNDPQYVRGYKKTAAGKNTGNAALGWATWLLILLI